jgi:hypothetical protein
MKKILTTTAVMMALALTANAWAQSQCTKGKNWADSGAKKTCDKSKQASCSGKQMAGKSGCCAGGKAALASNTGKSGCSSAGKAAGCNPGCCDMPKMVYQVGDDTTCCAMTAEKMAKESGKSMHFVVANKEFENQAKAEAAYTAALNEYANGMTTVRYMAGGKCVACPTEAKNLAKSNGGEIKYCVGSFVFTDKAKAESAAKAAKSAMKQVKWNIKVGDKSYCCDKMAAMAAKSNGSKCEFQVGDCKTPCKKTAEMELARARVEAARKALSEQTDA